MMVIHFTQYGCSMSRIGTLTDNHITKSINDWIKEDVKVIKYCEKCIAFVV